MLVLVVYVLSHSVQIHSESFGFVSLEWRSFFSLQSGCSLKNQLYCLLHIEFLPLELLILLFEVHLSKLSGSFAVPLDYFLLSC